MTRFLKAAAKTIGIGLLVFLAYLWLIVDSAGTYGVGWTGTVALVIRYVLWTGMAIVGLAVLVFMGWGVLKILHLLYRYWKNPDDWSGPVR